MELDHFQPSGRGRPAEPALQGDTYMTLQPTPAAVAGTPSAASPGPRRTATTAAGNAAPPLPARTAQSLRLRREDFELDNPDAGRAAYAGDRTFAAALHATPELGCLGIHMAAGASKQECCLRTTQASVQILTATTAQVLAELSLESLELVEHTSNTIQMVVAGRDVAGVFYFDCDDATAACTVLQVPMHALASPNPCPALAVRAPILAPPWPDAGPCLRPGRTLASRLPQHQA